jgi:uncharacterized membrane protein YdbT with pleckstrin-like domain
MSVMNPNDFTMKPKKTTFIGTRIVSSGVSAVVLTIGSLIAREYDVPSIVLLVPVFAIVAFAFSAWNASVAYRKEVYEFRGTQIRSTRGGLFSTEITDLEISNITHIKLHLPWLRWRFFGVGSVRIESAGSSSSEITLRLIEGPEEARDRIRELMRLHGFSLTREELLHEESPAPAGVALDCLSLAFSAIFAGGFFVGEIFLEKGLKSASLGEIPEWALAGGLAVLCAVLIRLVLHWFDLSRRTYRVYTDCVEYEEGFLTRTNSFLPVENIADSSTSRSLVDLILGLYSVSISCQGSGSAIHFRRLKGGEQLSTIIDNLVSAQAAAPPPASAPSPVEEPTSPVEGAERLAPSREENDSVPEESVWTAELSMDLRRTLVPLLLFLPAFPVWALMTVGALIRTQTVRYSVRANSVRWSAKFLSVKQREFSYDKVTGVVVLQNPWDILFSTATVRLWSIGSGHPLDLKHVPTADLDLEALLAQTGIPRSTSCVAVPSNLSLRAWVLGRSPLLFTAGLFAIVLAALSITIHGAFLLGLFPLLFVVSLGLLRDYLWCSRQFLGLHPHHLEAKTGIIMRRHTHIAFEDIKKVTSIQIPGCDTGWVQVFAAGENLGTDATQNGMAVNVSGHMAGAASYGVTLRFLGEIERKRVSLDALITGHDDTTSPSVGSETLRESKPDAANSLIVVFLGSVILFPLLLLLPLTLSWTLLSVRRRRYRIERDRVVAESGVFFRKHQSVLWSRIDSLKSNKGVLNTLLGNGSVTLLTAGSSHPDLVLSALPDCDEFYRELLQEYGG